MDNILCPRNRLQTWIKEVKIPQYLSSLGSCNNHSCETPAFHFLLPHLQKKKCMFCIIIWFNQWGSPTFTRVQANPNPDFEFRHVPHLECPNAVQDVQRHVGHLCCMTIAVPVGDSWSYHVRISYSFHLNDNVSIITQLMHNGKMWQWLQYLICSAWDCI